MITLLRCAEYFYMFACIWHHTRTISRYYGTWTWKYRRRYVVWQWLAACFFWGPRGYRGKSVSQLYSRHITAAENV